MNKLIAGARSTLAILALSVPILTSWPSLPARAQTASSSIDLECNESKYVAPNHGRTYLNVVGNPTSSNPNIAVASGSVGDPRAHGRVRPGGTDGGITVSAGGQEGSTVITYGLENQEGVVTTVYLDVQVHCKKPKKTATGEPPRVDPPVPPAPPQPLPPSPGPGAKPQRITIGMNAIPTHRVSSCAACQPIVKALNEVIDRLSSEMVVVRGHLEGPESAAADYAAYTMLVAELDECERKCVVVPVPAAVVPVTPGTLIDVPRERTDIPPRLEVPTVPAPTTIARPEESVIEVLKPHTAPRTDVTPGPGLKPVTPIVHQPTTLVTPQVQPMKPRTDVRPLVSMPPRTMVAPVIKTTTLPTPTMSRVAPNALVNRTAPTLTSRVTLNHPPLTLSQPNAIRPMSFAAPRLGGGFRGSRLGGLALPSRDAEPQEVQD